MALEQALIHRFAGDRRRAWTCERHCITGGNRSPKPMPGVQLSLGVSARRRMSLRRRYCTDVADGTPEAGDAVTIPRSQQVALASVAGAPSRVGCSRAWWCAPTLEIICQHLEVSSAPDKRTGSLRDAVTSDRSAE